MKIIITKEQLNVLTENLHWSKENYMKTNDIYDYEPTQSEIDDFIKDKNQYIDYSDNPKFLKKEKKPINRKKHTGMAILYSSLDGEIDHGTYALMNWKKNKMIDENPLNKHILKVVPQKIS